MKNLVMISALGFIAQGCADTSFSSNKHSDSEPKTIFWAKEEVTPEPDSPIQNWDTGEGNIAGSGPASNRVWLNFDGADVTSEESFIVDNAQETIVTIPAFKMADIAMADMSEADRPKFIADVMTNLELYFKRINIEISLEKPEEPYSVLHIGGTNFTLNEGITGIAPYDPGNFKSDDILFVFSEGLKGVESTDKMSLMAITIAHEIAHSFGTRHIEDEKAIMASILRISTNEFNRKGPYPDLEGSENSREVLVHNVGGSRIASLGDSAEVSAPVLSLLGVNTNQDIAQYSVFTRENFKLNPDTSLASFNYKWNFEGEEVEGPLVRIKFEDDEIHDLEVTVTNADGDLAESYFFKVGHIDYQE